MGESKGKAIEDLMDILLALPAKDAVKVKGNSIILKSKVGMVAIFIVKNKGEGNGQMENRGI